MGEGEGVIASEYFAEFKVWNIPERLLFAPIKSVYTGNVLEGFHLWLTTTNMAMHIPRAPGFSQMLKDGAKVVFVWSVER